ncbi:Uncharacterised protein g2397 [Pycnogonum litorale]
MVSCGRCSCTTLVILSILTWLLGSGLLGFILWILGTTDNMKRFFTGSLVFTYVMLIHGVLLFLCGEFYPFNSN